MASGSPYTGLLLAAGAVGIAALAGALVTPSGSRAPMSRQQRDQLPSRDFVFPRQRRYPIQDVNQARLALTYAMAPSNRDARYEVMFRVFHRYPELAVWWNSTDKGSKIPVSRAHLESELGRVRWALSSRRLPASRRKVLEDKDAALRGLIQITPWLHKKATAAAAAA